MINEMLNNDFCMHGIMMIENYVYIYMYFNCLIENFLVFLFIIKL